MIDLLRRGQLYLQRKFREFINTRNAIVLVMINSGIIASYQKNCIDSVIDIRSIAQIVFNSLLLLGLIDVRIINFLKLFTAGALSHLLTSEAIGLYMRYLGGMGKKCKLPLYIDGNFNVFVAVSITIGVFYWIFSDNEKTEIKNNDFPG